MKKVIKWIILLIGLIGFLIILQNVFKNEVLLIDTVIYNFISKYFITDTFTKIIKVITNIGGEIILLTVVLISLFVCKNEKIGISIFVNLITIAGLNFILKNIVERTRPVGFRIMDVTGYSFPSGHSMVGMAFYGYIIYLIYKLVKNNYAKWLSITVLSMTIVSIGFSRIYLGVHYASDVLGGFLLSIAYLIVFVTIAEIFVFDKEGDNIISTKDKRIIKVKTKKIANSFKYAIQGLISSFKSERNMKIHVLIMILVIMFGILLQISIFEWIICILLFGIVIGSELINTAIETVVDMVMPNKNEKAKLAKDVSAGAVLVFAISAAIIGMIIFIPKFIIYLN